MKILLLSLLSLLLTSLVSGATPDFKKNPVVYGLSALYLSEGYGVKGLVAIRKRLPEIKELGANIIWLQPITPPFEEDGHGYDVIDYKKVWDKLGSEKDLKDLIKEAHRLNIRVMLDMVLNHSSFMHPFVQDIVKRGKASPYFDYYQHEPIVDIPYSHHFQTRQIGKGAFIHYFWDHLLNFNFNHKPLREYLFGVLEYWVKEYDIDGYRFDASWGPSTRWPAFYPTVNKRLRKLKPDIILMAEDMAGYPAAYAGSNHPHLKGSGFDWAYDWNNEDPDWISKWSFQQDGDNFESSVFNLEDPVEAADAFLNSIRYGQSVDGIRPVRYLENNDTPGFLMHHTLAQAKWAAKIIFLLPGVPLIFYGQETGNKHELYELPSFDPEIKLSARNPRLWNFYKKLVALRRSSPALSEGSLKKVRKTAPEVVTFERVLRNQKVKIELNFRTKKVRLNSRLLSL